MSAQVQRSRPLRIKLTLWYLLVFSVLQAGLTFAVVLWRRDSIVAWREDRDTTVADVMVENILVAEPEDWSEGELGALVPADAGFVACAVRDAGGNLLVSWGFDQPEEVPFGAEELRPAGPVRAVFRSLPASGAGLAADRAAALRLITVPFRYDERAYFLQAAVPTTFSLGPFQDLVLISGPVGLIAALVASWLIAGRAVAPIHQLSEAAKSVSPTSLGERIEVRTTDGEVSGLQGELNLALQRLEEGYRAQERFVSNVSHELKTPIAVLLTDSQVIQLREEDLDGYKRFAQRVESEMQCLARLLESFLTLARSDIAQGPPLIQALSVNDVVLDSIQHCGSYAKNQDIHLVPRLAAPADGDDGLEPIVAGDPELLRTMLDNVVRNAIRHSPPRGAVDIDVVQEATYVEVHVSDRGPGIPEEYLERVFDRLVRGPEAGGTEGHGLGLAITRNIAQLHDGQVTARNTESGGATFVIRLPRATEDPSVEDDDEEADQRAGGSNGTMVPRGPAASIASGVGSVSTAAESSSSKSN